MTYEKRLLDVLFLMHWNFATFRYSQDKATVDAHGYATILVSVFCRYGLSISAWASALLVFTIPGNAKASMRETSSSAKVPRFFCAILPQFKPNVMLNQELQLDKKYLSRFEEEYLSGKEYTHSLSEAISFAYDCIAEGNRPLL